MTRFEAILWDSFASNKPMRALLITFTRHRQIVFLSAGTRFVFWIAFRSRRIPTFFCRCFVLALFCKGGNAAVCTM